MSTRRGTLVARDSEVVLTQAKERLAQTKAKSINNLRTEWEKAIKKPIDEVKGRFARLKAGGRSVVVSSPVPSSAVEELHESLRKIDPNYSSDVKVKSDLPQVPLIVKYWKDHVVKTPYSFSLQKCNDATCCGPLRTPDRDGIRELAMQRQPTPLLDPRRKGHFLSRDDALKATANNPDASSDMSDLPSDKDDQVKQAATKRAQRDIALAKLLKMKSWDPKKVRAFLTCYHCGKRRCVYSPTDPTWEAGKEAFQQKLESVSERYSCGDLLFDDEHHLSKVIVQKQSLTCESPIEKAYYNPNNHTDRKIKLKDICIHCGEGRPEDFLLRLPQLQERCMTDGYKCFPICISCIDSGKKVVKSGKKNALQERAEKIAKRRKLNDSSSDK